MKKRKIFLIIVIVLVGFWLINKGLNYLYFKNNVYLDQNPHSKHLDFVIKRVSHHYISFDFNQKEAEPTMDKDGVLMLDTLPNKDTYTGWIYIDTAKRQYYFHETYYKALPKQANDEYTPSEEMHRWITLNKDGNVIDSTAIDSLMPPPNAILLKDEKGNFPDWDDKKSVVYMRYFAHEQFNWDIFNFYRGFGGNGGGNRIYWYGHAYYTINYQGQKIEFKEEAQSYRDFNTGLNFSVTPSDVKNMPAIIFIISDKHFERSGLYVVTKK